MMTDRSEIFKIAHKLTKETLAKKSTAGRNYSVTFGACLRSVYSKIEQEKKIMELKELIEKLSNKAAKSATANDFDAVVGGLKDINNSVKIIKLEVLEGSLCADYSIIINDELTIEKGIKLGKFISLLKANTTSKLREEEIRVRNALKKESPSTTPLATKVTRKPKSIVITKNGSLVSFDDMMTYLHSISSKRRDSNYLSYNARFIRDIYGKSKLTARQHNFLCEVSYEHGYEMEKRKVRARKVKVKKEINNCQHEDLGSLGYAHGETVKCPFCGDKAQVW